MTCLVGQLFPRSDVNQWGMRPLPRLSFHWTMLAFCASARRLPSHYPFLAPTHSPSLPYAYAYTNGEEEGRSLCFRPLWSRLPSLSHSDQRYPTSRWLVGGESVAQIKHITEGGRAMAPMARQPSDPQLVNVHQCHTALWIDGWYEWRRSPKVEDS